jgi:hypothetical protein
VPQYQAYSATLFRDTISVMGFLGYYAKVLRVAFTHSLDIAQSIIFAFLIIIGVAPYLLQGFGVTPRLDEMGNSFNGLAGCHRRFRDNHSNTSNPSAVLDTQGITSTD